MIIAAFITSLTIIGVVTLPLEIKELDGRFAALRNGTSFVALFSARHLSDRAGLYRLSHRLRSTFEPPC
ncbi:MAG: hypothetical protein K9L68_11885 [Spirochaetales bacterium]|nr:hypothetical protein [Spirochaetales bacterium]MCF7939290.1 hypothetical protein [Spirochaetales bacterium]